MERSVVRTMIIFGLSFCAGRTLQAAHEPHYVRQTPNSRGVIVFVHGLFGDSKTSWTNDRSHAYWPDLLTKDSTFNGFDVYVYEYSSPRIGNTYSIDEITESMRAYLDADRVMQHRDVIFLAHSLGGIVVRAYLTKYPTHADPVRLAYFLATPTTGSSVATVGSLISGNPQIDELRPMKSTAYLANLQRQWLAAQFKFPSYCAYEVQRTSGVLVVEQASASNLCTKPLDPIDTDHIGIAKPESNRGQQYITFSNAFVAEIVRTNEASQVNAPSVQHSKLPAPGSAPDNHTQPVPQAPGPLTTIQIATQKQVASADSEFRYGLEVILTTTKDVSPTALRITFSGNVGKMYGHPPGQIYTEAQGGIVASKPDTVLLEWRTPAFSVAEPIVFTVYSKTYIIALKVESVPFTFPYSETLINTP